MAKILYIFHHLFYLFFSKIALTQAFIPVQTKTKGRLITQSQPSRTIKTYVNTESRQKLLNAKTSSKNNNDELENSKSNSQSTSNSLNEFRSLMGKLYGIAGLAHGADCFFGSSQLLTSAGSLPFYDLPPGGRALATLWCVMGPVSYISSLEKSRDGFIADLGLLAYGVVEVGAAFVLSSSTVTASQLSDSSVIKSELDPFANAVLVQVVVLISWIYSSSRSTERTLD